jgi:hypothetical protein
MLILFFVVLSILLAPGEAHAWGPITHIVHGTSVLASLDRLPGAMAALLSSQPSCYLYGCVGADIIQAKAYTRDVASHCHRWPTAWRLVSGARSDRELAFAWGYMTHLAADILSHNHFVPASLLRSFASPTLGHAWWEARFDALQAARNRQDIREVLSGRYEDCDGLVGRVVEDTLLPLRANKRIFDSMMALSKLDRWQAFMARLGERSRHSLRGEIVDRYNAACVEAALDLLAHGEDSSTQERDPTGEDVLHRAIALRRQLRSLKRQGRLDATLEREILEDSGLEEPRAENRIEIRET